MVAWSEVHRWATTNAPANSPRWEAGRRGEAAPIEAKCPKTTTHLRWMDEGVIPEEHLLPQLWFGLMVDEELSWIDFISRDGGMSMDPRSSAASCRGSWRSLPSGSSAPRLSLKSSRCARRRRDSWPT